MVRPLGFSMEFPGLKQKPDGKSDRGTWADRRTEGGSWRGAALPWRRGKRQRRQADRHGAEIAGVRRHIRSRKRGADGHGSRHALDKMAVWHCVAAILCPCTGKMAVDVNLYYWNKSRLESR